MHAAEPSCDIDIGASYMPERLTCHGRGAAFEAGTRQATLTPRGLPPALPHHACMHTASAGLPCGHTGSASMLEIQACAAGIMC